jgi:hypothetical protein
VTKRKKRGIFFTARKDPEKKLSTQQKNKWDLGQRLVVDEV